MRFGQMRALLTLLVLATATLRAPRARADVDTCPQILAAIQDAAEETDGYRGRDVSDPAAVPGECSAAVCDAGIDDAEGYSSSCAMPCCAMVTIGEFGTLCINDCEPSSGNGASSSSPPRARLPAPQAAAPCAPRPSTSCWPSWRKSTATP